MFKIMGTRFPLLEKGIILKERGKTKPAVFNWNYRHQCELLVLYTQTNIQTYIHVYLYLHFLVVIC